MHFIAETVRSVVQACKTFAERNLMRRPLFTACLCLVIALAIGNILTGADTGDKGGLPPDGSPVRITGRIDTRTSETIILESISIIQNDQQYSYSGKLQCELTNVEKNAAEDNGLKIGQKVILEGTFAYFSTASNPGEFDVQAYYAGKGIGGRVRKAQIVATGEDYYFLLHDGSFFFCGKSCMFFVWDYMTGWQRFSRTKKLPSCRHYCWGRRKRWMRT